MSDQIATVLPKLARATLAKALAVDPDVAPGLSQARSRALESAIYRVKSQYPSFFRKEN